MLILRELLLLFISYGAMIVYMMNVPRVLHYMQLEGYKYSDFMRWLTKNPKLAFKGRSKADNCNRWILYIYNYYKFAIFKKIV